jgi:D-sedoheptulose 7-phosphate isomerase
MEMIDNYFTDLKQTIDGLSTPVIEQVVALLRQARANGRQVFICGNGGSASTASHFACDLAKNTRQPDQPPFRVIGLTDNMAMLSAYANDEGYENVFAQQLALLVRPLDVVIAISASGQSPNVLKVVEMACQHGATTVAFTGFDGGRLGLMADIHLHVASNRIEQVEDLHLVLQHLICCLLRQ